MFDLCLVPCSGPWANQWSFVASHWEPRDLYLLGQVPRDYKPLKTAKEIGHFGQLPDVPLVVLQPPTGRNVAGEIPLPEFEHPEECIYLFGADHGILEMPVAPTYKVYIPTETHHEMYSWVAGGITLYDRMIKGRG